MVYQNTLSNALVNWKHASSPPPPPRDVAGDVTFIFCTVLHLNFPPPLWGNLSVTFPTAMAPVCNWKILLSSYLKWLFCIADKRDKVVITSLQFPVESLCIPLQSAESGKQPLRRERQEMLPKQTLCRFTQFRSGDKWPHLSWIRAFLDTFMKGDGGQKYFGATLHVFGPKCFLIGHCCTCFWAKLWFNWSLLYMLLGSGACFGLKCDSIALVRFWFELQFH